MGTAAMVRIPKLRKTWPEVHNEIDARLAKWNPEIFDGACVDVAMRSVVLVTDGDDGIVDARGFELKFVVGCLGG
jgi:hypothetical protein